MANRIGGTMIQVKEGVRIENPRNYEPCTIESLRSVLAAGNEAQRDPQRANFYEVDGDGETYYVHISPVSGNVVLLARWLRQAQDCCASSAQFVA
jgi:hypothetical protein